MSKQYTTLPVDSKFIRADKFLSLQLPEYSRAALKKLFDLNLIKINDEAIEPGFRVKPGTTLEYDLGPLQAKPEVIELPIIYEDENVIVIDKPAGIISHARGKFWQEASVASFIRDRVSDMTGERPGIVHRLDRATSGVMICAKNEKTLKILQNQFHDRKVIKKYIAIIEGKTDHDEALIDAAIIRNAKNPKKFMVSKEGKSAQTYYKTKKTTDRHSLLELVPKTGRTHQLRIHLLYIGHPIVGDLLYGGKANDRLMLHAFSLQIEIPKYGQKTFKSEIPKEFDEVINKT